VDMIKYATGMTPRGGNVVIRGMSVSGNVIPAVLLVKDVGCGDLEVMDIMKGENMTEAMLKINPWHQMPNMTDDTLNLAESGAIIRYIANQYAPEKYGGKDMKTRAVIDWALEWASTNFSKNFSCLWYPTTGFGAAPEDYAAEIKKTEENLAQFVTVFLTGPGAFIGGATKPTIADYVCAVRFHMVGHAAVKKTTGFELPARIVEYVGAFLAECPSKEFLKGHDGFLDTKL